MKKVLMWAGVVFLVFFVAYDPDSAGSIVGNIAGVIAFIGVGFAKFIGGLV